jgi:hypothetical protein
MDIDPAYISPDTVGMFDVVLYLGVLYHRPDCFQAFKNAASVCLETLVVETLIDERLGESRPLFSFYPFNELGGDPTNWFAPNLSAVIAMFKSCGFQQPLYVVNQSPLPNYPRAIFVGKRSTSIQNNRSVISKPSRLHIH